MGILTEDMQRVVREQRLGYVATVCADGTPSVSPKGTTTVWDDGHLIFADICSPGTIANLTHNPAVEVNVVDPITRRGYRFKGQATIVGEGSLFERAMSFFRKTYGLSDALAQRVEHVVLIEVRRAVPLISPIYDTGASEEDVVRRYVGYYENIRRQRAGLGA
ncbi:MAG TPA: pyridoxamine 5'-phosphate oxidase family protein [bacterium]|nr:pyridoxamine 5'-phosphate oxidase family protein [bacterium]